MQLQIKSVTNQLEVSCPVINRSHRRAIFKIKSTTRRSNRREVSHKTEVLQIGVLQCSCAKTVKILVNNRGTISYLVKLQVFRDFKDFDQNKEQLFCKIPSALENKTKTL